MFFWINEKLFLNALGKLRGSLRGVYRCFWLSGWVKRVYSAWNSSIIGNYFWARWTEFLKKANIVGSYFLVPRTECLGRIHRSQVHFLPGAGRMKTPGHMVSSGRLLKVFPRVSESFQEHGLQFLQSSQYSSFILERPITFVWREKIKLFDRTGARSNGSLNNCRTRNMMSSKLAIWPNSATTTVDKRKTAQESTRKTTKGSILRNLPVLLTVPLSKLWVNEGKKTVLRAL